MIRILMVAVFLSTVAACSLEPPSAPDPYGDETIEVAEASPDTPVEMTVGGEKRHIKWPLVPGWDSVYGPDGRVGAWFKQTCRDAINLQKAVDQFMEDGYPVYPYHPYAELNDSGRSVMDYMPHGGRVTNHFTGQETWIGWDCQAERVGEICYMTIMDLNGYNVGYVISARGAYWKDFLRISYVDSSLVSGP